MQRGVFEQRIARRLSPDMAMFARKVGRDDPLARLVPRKTTAKKTTAKKTAAKKPAARKKAVGE